jgi:hypothetical protein
MATMFTGTLTGGVWTPAELTTAAWFDASDVTTINHSNGAVRLWNDKSGHDLNLSQGTASLQPVTGAAINGLNALNFTGDRMSTASNPFGGVISNAFVIVVHKVDAIANGILFSLTGATTPTTSRWQANAPYGDGQMNFDVNASGTGANRLSATYGVTTGSTAIASFYCSTIDNVQQVYKNGTLLAGDSSGASATPVSGISIGGASTVYQDTTLGEVIIINGTVDVNTRQNLEGYLAHKWGLTASLPTNHPYKAIAPAGSGALAVQGLPQVTESQAVPYMWLTAANESWSTNYEAAVQADPDGDGFTTGQEYWSGTDPQDPGSCFKLDRVKIEGGHVVLEWRHSAPAAAVPDVTIRMTDDLGSGNWTTVGIKRPVDGLNSWTNTSGSTGFYSLIITNVP